ncbi:MAG: hypothetical protein DRP90_04810 [Planctomycetota bacterium]|nr:MAG: hypothetical protein DRP90_04810 [Planctomycetota bacterium]
MAEEYLDFSQALEALNITETELWELIHSGTLKAYRAGGVIKFKKSDIIAYQKSRGTEPTIVVSRRMLDTMDEGEADEEGMDTEVGLRAARRPAEDDLATSEVTVKERAVAPADETEQLPPRRRPSARATARTGAVSSVRSKRISQVLETEKKGNPIMNAVMVLSCLVLLYCGLVEIAIAQNNSWTENGMVRIGKPSWIARGMYDWGSSLGGDKYGALAAMKELNVTVDYTGVPIVPDQQELRKKYDEQKNKNNGEEPGENTEEEGAGEGEGA